MASDTALHYLGVMFGSSATYFFAVYGIIQGILALFVPFVQKFFGLKSVLHLSSVLCLIFIAMILISQFLIESSEDESLPPVGFVLVIIGAAAYGCGSAMFWFSYSSFFDALTTPLTRGTLVGIFFGIFYINSPVGNLLAGILNATSLKGSIIQIIFTSFAIVGALVLIPLRGAKLPPGRQLSFKMYFKEMLEIAKVPSYYTAVVALIVIYIVDGFMVAVFSEQLPEETAKQLVGYSFAIAGVAMCIGVARIVFFVITFIIYGMLTSISDVNNFWIAFDTCHHNAQVFLQYCRFLGNGAYGIVSLTSIVGVDYPQYYIIILTLIGIIYALMGWNVDTHHASFAHVKVCN
ncbi:MAG: hypothetical protein EZS28_030391 [Streblomastix strix]|uniref:Uncharacterized protein n=1 Tax=Streblomastix strix TaxID=222440 RepID=A0A5J4UVG4_9EUKA|nr:MAG: hypothetical protein EZS28_030391 [Streblomastix strix]